MQPRPVTTPSPLPPFQAPAEMTMTLDEAIAATHVFCQAFVGAQNLATALISAKRLVAEAGRLRPEVDSLTAQRDAAQEALTQFETGAATRRAQLEGELVTLEARADKTKAEFEAHTAALRQEAAELEAKVSGLRAELARLKEKF